MARPRSCFPPERFHACNRRDVVLANVMKHEAKGMAEAASCLLIDTQRTSKGRAGTQLRAVSSASSPLLAAGSIVTTTRRRLAHTTTATLRCC
jgi:hypothetical protein